MNKKGYIKQSPKLSEESTKLRQDFFDGNILMDSSKKTYGYGLDCFLTWCEKNGLNPVRCTEKEIKDYESYLNARSLSNCTIASYKQAVRKMYTWLESMGKVKGLSKKINSQKISAQRTKRLTDNGISTFVEQVATDKDRNARRNQCIVSLIIDTGIKTRELCRLDIADVSFSETGATLQVYGKGKHGKDHELTVSAVVADQIKQYLDDREMKSPRDPLFVTNGDGGPHKNRRMSPRSIQMLCKKYLNILGLSGQGYSVNTLRQASLRKNHK